MKLSNWKKEQIKSKALTDLYNSGELQHKIHGICIRHRIPLDADIQSDILQVTFENLMKFPTDRFVTEYHKNPKNILALGVTLSLRKGVYIDKRIPKGWAASIARQIINQSTLNTLDHIDSTSDSNEEHEYNVPLIAPEENADQLEQDHIEMWQHIRNELTPLENDLLTFLLNPDNAKEKIKGRMKQDYHKLLPKMKQIITEYQIQKEQWN